MIYDCNTICKAILLAGSISAIDFDCLLDGAGAMNFTNPIQHRE